MSKKHKENILIVNGFAIERASMRALLASEKKIGEVYEASDLEEVEQEMKSNEFSLIICSLISLDQKETLLLTKIKQMAGEQPILILGPDKGYEHILSIIKLGIHGYISKNENRDVLMKGVHMLLKGEEYFPGVNGKGLKQEPPIGKKEKPSISDREKEILRLVIMGMNNNNIGEQLNISVRTVENHRANMMRKLHVKNTAELVKVAVTEHLVE